MATTDSKKTPPKPAKGKTLTTEEIYNGFQLLRNEQRNLINKLSEVEMDLNEHKMVLDTLKDLDGGRKCFRLIGGVLCEKTVKDVIPTLTTNRDQLSALAETLNEQVTKKGLEINEYKEKNNIRIRGQDEIPSAVNDENEQKSEAQPRNVIMVNPI
uniref:Putative molecular chaperone prefoldin subunit 2 n=1 Tax=Triatoma dimidiata TaxID=72491 RepID=A0A0V0G7R5_TRIDM